jgi:hypothetical protein
MFTFENFDLVLDHNSALADLVRGHRFKVDPKVYVVPNVVGAKPNVWGGGGVATRICHSAVSKKEEKEKVFACSLKGCLKRCFFG